MPALPQHVQRGTARTAHERVPEQSRVVGGAAGGVGSLAWRGEVQEEYHATRDKATMPHPATLQNHAGSWAAVVALVG